MQNLSEILNGTRNRIVNTYTQQVEDYWTEDNEILKRLDAINDVRFFSGCDAGRETIKVLQCYCDGV